MSIDRTLKVKGALVRHRNVLSRHERVEQLKDDQRWSEGDSVLALPKVAHRKSYAGKKEKKALVPEAGAAATTEAAAPAKQADKKS
ncbi:MAG TPA: small basic protein [Sedimentisphaerales bacterium]|nr:small basic protein [Sedimentisphaerales bacterium]